MPEIDENQLATFTNLQGFVQKALASPQHRQSLLKIQKDLYPDVPVPEIDAANPILEKLSALEQKFEDDRKAREEAATKAAKDAQDSEWTTRWNKGHEMLAGRFNEEGVAAIEKMMHERGIADHEAAMALFEKHNPPPPPPLTGSSRFNWFEQVEGAPDVNMLLEKQDYDGFLGQAVDMARRQFRAAGGQG
ncbi:MAG TPA: hypothetical protein VGR84_19005 [Candidatus Acidoferrales bacterium]|nr:hypothetical protein [Candidatus Acidoferrales bacterium]